MNTQRTDTHKPSTMDPAEYVECGYFDLHHDEGGSWIDHDTYTEYGVEIGDSFSGNFENRGRCDHCGAGPLRYGVVFIHIPSKKEVVVGERCAGILGLPSKTAREHKQLLETAIRERKVAEWTAASEDNAVARQYLIDQVIGNDNHGYGGFFFDLLHKLNRYGNLSEKQVAAVLKSKARDEEFASRKQAEAAEAAPFVEGRRIIEGEVLSVKVKDGYYGMQVKMLIKEDDGNKVWGTVPEVLEMIEVKDADGTHTGTRMIEKGERVRITATVERSQDDEHFGFYKRPTKPELLSDADAPVAEARQERQEEVVTEAIETAEQILSDAQAALDNYDPADFEWFDGETEIQEAHEAKLRDNVAVAADRVKILREMKS